jgi:uncharacterized protein (DUF1501 family)
MLFGELGDSVSAFVDALRSDPKGKEAVVVVSTEFGRRVAGNASGWTDFSQVLGMDPSPYLGGSFPTLSFI